MTDVKRVKKLYGEDVVALLLKKALEAKPRVSLSRLLSVIDGLPDGVILVMTGNKPESLEQALIRPGHIDEQVLHGNGSHAVARLSLHIHQNYSNALGLEEGLAVMRPGQLGDAFASRLPFVRLARVEIE